MHVLMLRDRDQAEYLEEVLEYLKRHYSDWRFFLESELFSTEISQLTDSDLRAKLLDRDGDPRFNLILGNSGVLPLGDESAKADTEEMRVQKIYEDWPYIGFYQVEEFIMEEEE